MPDLGLLATFAMTNFLLNISPGPAVLQVLGHAIANGALRAQASVLGILAGNLVYCTLSALGLGAILIASPTLFGVLRYLGVAYLLYIGVRRMLARSQPLAVKAAGAGFGPLTLFRDSLLLQLSNPKSLLFFGAMLPTFVDPARPAGPQIFTLGVLAILLELPVLAAYALLGARIATSVENPRYHRWLDLACGGMLVVAALFVATTPVHPPSAPVATAAGGTPS
ncbi:LysE family translocator [Caldimonas brevitalea]|uniref:LysE family translocator n=1 Tax=Caldimonas brevitalea TaxID=413882 RepID=A0A0G3BNC7_9BURK|nr:LysE family translocator [Caldimonas brevitalea]AKJ30954.1 hypothetical protein AAW51_4263 [Caldimonas brevitalea]